MRAFQTTTVVVAVVLLVIFLIVIAYGVKQAVKNAQWPPEVGNCPDYWQDAGGNLCTNPLGLGKCGTQKDVGVFSDSKLGRVAKCRWANGCGITWDGITDVGPCDSLAD